MDARRLGIGATLLVVVALAAAWLLAWIPQWTALLVEHFRVQLVVIGVVACVAAGALRRRGLFDVALITTLLHALPIVSDLTASRRAVPDGVAVRVLLLNVHTESTTYAEVRALIAAEDPDVIALVEVSRTWLDELAPALARYRQRIEAPRDDNAGVALYARDALGGTVEGGDRPTIVGELAIDGARFAVTLLHPFPPLTDARLAQQEAQLAQVAGWAAASTLPTLVMGDFNTAPWTRVFARFVGRSRLCDSRTGFGVQASFPATSALLRIPIDHLLASCAIGVRDRRIGGDVGSDHLPVIVDLVIPTGRGLADPGPDFATTARSRSVETLGTTAPAGARRRP